MAYLSRTPFILRKLTVFIVFIIACIRFIINFNNIVFIETQSNLLNTFFHWLI